MVQILLEGRLGNNLFQIATAAILAYRNNTSLKVFTGAHVTPDGFTLFEYLQQFNNNILRKIDITQGFPNVGKLYKEPHYTYKDIYCEKDIILSGFFQSYKYLDTKLVQDLFQIDENTKNYIQTKYGHLFNEEIISINIRRGDYLKSLTTQYAH